MSEKLLPGTWQVLRAELGGQPMPADAAAQVTLRFTATTYAVSFGAEVTDEGTYRLQATGDSTVIFLTGEAGLNAGRTIPGILQVVGDRMRICYALEGDRPPDQCKVTPGVLHYLATYRRVT